jgi:hypothetical protein
MVRQMPRIIKKHNPLPKSNAFGAEVLGGDAGEQCA